MNVSVVVPTYERPADLVDCIESLRAQFDPPEEIIVIDDGSVAETERRLAVRGLLDDERVRHLEGPADGLPAARNAGVDAATGDVVAFVDDDVVVPPDWTRRLGAAYEAFPEAAGVGGYVLNYNPEDINKANVESAGYRLLQAFRRVFLRGRVGDIGPVGVLWAPHVFMTSRPETVDALQGCNMSFRSDVFEEHRFDEWYGSSGSASLEDVDFGARLTSAGSTLVYEPRLVAIHRRTDGGGEAGRDDGPKYDDVTNLTYFILGHPEMGPANVLLLAALVAGYSLVQFDAGYVRRLIEGVLSHRRANGETPSG